MRPIDQSQSPSPRTSARGGSGEYAVGDRVEYYSASAGKWTKAKVLKVNSGGTYDLDCKKGVTSDKMRPLDQSLSPSPRTSARGGSGEYAVGDRVEYYSASAGKW